MDNRIADIHGRCKKQKQQRVSICQQGCPAGGVPSPPARYQLLRRRGAGWRGQAYAGIVENQDPIA
jgi:hypothetical protein